MTFRDLGDALQALSAPSNTHNVTARHERKEFVSCLTVMYAQLGQGLNPLSLRPLQRRNLTFCDGLLFIGPHHVVVMDGPTRRPVASSSTPPPKPHPLFEWLLLTAHAPQGPLWLTSLPGVPSPVCAAVVGSGSTGFNSGGNSIEMASAVRCASELIGAELVVGSRTLVQIDSTNDLPLRYAFNASVGDAVSTSLRATAARVPADAPLMVPASSISRKRTFTTPASAMTSVQPPRFQPTPEASTTVELRPSEESFCTPSNVPATEWIPAFTPLFNPSHCSSHEPVALHPVHRTPADLLTMLRSRP